MDRASIDYATRRHFPRRIPPWVIYLPAVVTLAVFILPPVSAFICVFYLPDVKKGSRR